MRRTHEAQGCARRRRWRATSENRTFRSSPQRLRQESNAPKKKMERVMGIEPTLVAWEATVLPLNYTRFASDSMHRPCGGQLPG